MSLQTGIRWDRHGLTIQAAVILTFDIFADHRAHAYLEWLRR